MNHKHYEYASTALTLVNVTNTTRLSGDKIEREKLEKLYMFCYVDIIDSGELCQSRVCGMTT